MGLLMLWLPGQAGRQRQRLQLAVLPWLLLPRDAHMLDVRRRPAAVRQGHARSALGQQLPAVRSHFRSAGLEDAMWPGGLLHPWPANQRLHIKGWSRLCLW